MTPKPHELARRIGGAVSVVLRSQPQAHDLAARLEQAEKRADDAEARLRRLQDILTRMASETTVAEVRAKAPAQPRYIETVGKVVNRHHRFS